MITAIEQHTSRRRSEWALMSLTSSSWRIRLIWGREWQVGAFFALILTPASAWNLILDLFIFFANGTMVRTAIRIDDLQNVFSNGTSLSRMRLMSLIPLLNGAAIVDLPYKRAAPHACRIRDDRSTLDLILTMKFKHPPGTPTKAWYDAYGILLKRGWRYKSIVWIGIFYYFSAKFVKWWVLFELQDHLIISGNINYHHTRPRIISLLGLIGWSDKLSSGIVHIPTS